MLCIKDFEEHAEKMLDKRAWAFFSQGSGDEFSMRDNLKCFNRFALIPRVLRNSERRDMNTRVLGHRIALPVGIAPTAYQKMAHPRGEEAAAAAAAEMNTVYTLSTVSTSSIEEVARSRPPSSSAPLWMQLYIMRDKAGTLDIVRRAEGSGFEALVLTVDTPVIGLQLRMKRNGLVLPPHLSVPNIENALAQTRGKGHENHLSNVNLLEGKLTWDDVTWLKSVTRLPIVLKGIMTAEDAVLATKHGASAVWVSNHGGRQLDGILSGLDVLPEVCQALSGTGCEVFVDGGVRWGTDVLKALALGAQAVFIGRPTIWGLAHSGQDGVRSVLEILRDELDNAMHLAGVNNLSEVGPHLVTKRQIAHM